MFCISQKFTYPCIFSYVKKIMYSTFFKGLKYFKFFTKLMANRLKFKFPNIDHMDQ